MAWLASQVRNLGRRRRGALAWGLPGLLVGSLGAVALRRAALDETIVPRSQRAAQDLLAEATRVKAAGGRPGGPATVALWHQRRLLRYTARSTQWMYEYSRTAMSLARVDEALGIIEPLVEKGGLRACLWRGDQLYALAQLDPRLYIAAAYQYRRVVRQQPGNVRIHTRLAMIARARKDWETTAAHLRAAVAGDPRLNADLAHAYMAWSRQAGVPAERVEQLVGLAHRAAQRAVAELTPRLKQTPGDPTVRRELARLLMLLERYEAAVGILEVGLRAGPDPGLATTASSAYLLWAGASAQDPLARVERLARALGHHRHNALALSRLLELTGEPAPVGPAARARVKALEPGLDRSFWYWVRSGWAWKQDRRADALASLEAARKAGGYPAAIIANDLAYMLAETRPQALELALALVEEAIRASPRMRRFRDTRGRILLKLGRYREALDDLEIARTAVADRAPVLRSIALAYQKLGMHDEAEMHLREAARLKQRDGDGGGR